MQDVGGGGGWRRGPDVSGSLVQPSAAAVTAVHTKAGLTARSLSARMSATAEQLSTAARTYTVQDADAAGQLSDVPVEV